MPIIHAISFDDAVDNATGYFMYGFHDISSYGNLSRRAGRYGGYAMGVVDVGTIDRSVRLPARSESFEWTVGFDFYWVTQTETDPRGFFDLLDTAGARMFRVALAADGTLKFYRGNGATLIGTTTTATVTSTWYHIEFQLRMNDTTGLLIVKVDGVEEINVSATDTLEAGVTTPSYWIWGSFGSATAHREKRMDNLIIQDELNWLGQIYAEPLTLTADTADKDWLRSTGSDNYALIDETLVNTADYVESGTVGDLDLYTLSNLSSNPESIEFVQTLAALKMGEAGTRVLRAALKSSVSTGYGSQRGVTDTSADRFYFDRFLLDPNGSVAWTKSAVDALTAGVEVYA
jgi:hypothetical protein